MLYYKMINRKKNLLEEIQNLENALAAYPDGKLSCSQNGKYIVYKHLLNGTYTCIPRKNVDFIKMLGEKALLCAFLKDLQKELKAVNAFLKSYESGSSKVEQLLSQSSYQTVIAQAFQPVSEDLKEWSRAEYERNLLHPENLIHSCLSGHTVRSKSEVLIAQALFMHKIPFRYECALKLENSTYYPDFTIRHPETGEYFYWEHFGLMDTPGYSKNAFQKLNIYCQHNIIPTINLITTYETKEHPLTSQNIENLIQEYFVL